MSQKDHAQPASGGFDAVLRGAPLLTAAVEHSPKGPEEAGPARDELARLVSILKATSDMVGSADVNGNILYLNPAGYRMIGLADHEDYSRLKISDLHAPSVAEFLAKTAIPLAIERGVWNGESTLRNLQGREIAISQVIIAHKNEAGDLQYLSTIARDITESKRIEQDLRMSEERLRQVVRCSQIGIFDHDHIADTLYYSPEMRAIFGWGADEPITLADYLSMVHPEALEEIAQAVRRAHDPSGDGLFDIENRHIRKCDGAVRWLTTRSQTFFAGEGANRHPVRTIGALVDVTERRQTEDRLRRQAALLEATHDAIIVTEDGQRVHYMNAAAEKLTGWSLAEAESRDLNEVLRPFSEALLRTALQEVGANQSWNGEMSLLTRSGKVCEADSRWTSFETRPGGPVSILITCNDITEKKLLERQYLRAQRLESVGTLASGVAHDLNNILSPILMGVEILSQNIQDEDSRGILAMMQGCVGRGSDTINQLLAFARGTKIEKGPMQPGLLLKEIARLLKQTLPKNIQIYLDFPKDPGMVLADPSQLHQVLMNLCVNARDAMPDGGGLFLTLENRVLQAPATGIHPKAKPILYAVFKVTDTGSGIPPEILDRIFDPFFTTKPLGKGTGLGLATVLGIVENHGGFVLVDSKPGQGTTFQVFLPAISPDDTVDSTDGREKTPRGHGELVLVVDDEPAILHMVTGILRRNGYEALTAAFTSEALHLYEKNPGLVRAVLTDIMMPVGDGRKLIAILHEQSPKLPILAMSGLASAEFQNEAMSLGARSFLRKPFTSEQLLTVIDEALKTPP